MFLPTLLFSSMFLAASSSSVAPLTHLQVISGYGFRNDPITGKSTFHKGIDLSAKRNETVYSLGKGIVVFSDKYKGYGSLVVISHNDGLTTHYAHLNSRYLQIGDIVGRGTPIGTVGESGRATGPHLHFEIRNRGLPLDPRKFMADGHELLIPVANVN